MRSAVPRRKPSTRSSRTPTPYMPGQRPRAPRSSLTSRTRTTAVAASLAAIPRDTSGPSAVTTRGDGSGDAGVELLLRLLRIVVRVDVGDVEGAVAADLHDRRHLRKRIVVQLARQEVEPAGG